MLQSMHKLFAGPTLVAVLMIAGLPAQAQIQGGSLTPIPANELAKLAASARSQFASVLAKALSPESVQAMHRLVKDQASIAGGVTNFDSVTAPCQFEGNIPLLGQEQFDAFFAPAGNGGAILNECSNFGVNGHSPQNFLAGGSGPGFQVAVVDDIEAQ